MPKKIDYCKKTPRSGVPVEPNAAVRVEQNMAWRLIKLPILDAVDAEWIAETQEAPLFFQSDWLRGLEKHNTGWHAEGWRWLRSDGTVAARAVVHRLSVSTQQGDSYVQTERAATGGTLRSLLRRWAPQGFRTTVVGPLFVTDLQPIYFSSSVTEEEQKSIETHLTTALLREKSTVLLYKDASLPLARSQFHWVKRGFHPYEVEPLMELQLDPDWTNEADYFAAFKTKFRTKALSVRSRSASCISVPIEASDWNLWYPALHNLYHQVESRAGFKLHPFPLEVLGTWLQSNPSSVHLHIYLHGDEQLPVGFRFGWLHRNSLHALFVGMDYAQHRDLCIYPRMLYDFAAYAIQHRATSVHFGRTAAEMKSGLGAVPLRSAGLTRATNPLLNAMVQPFLKKVVPPSYRIDRPFKQSTVLGALLGILLLPLAVQAQNSEPKGLEYSNKANWAMRPDLPLQTPLLEHERYLPKAKASTRPAVFYVYPTFYDRGQTWGVDPRDPKHQKEVIEKALPNQSGVFMQAADVYVPYYRQMRIDGYYTRIPSEKVAARTAFDTAYADVLRAYKHFLATVPPEVPLVIASHSQGTNHAERLLREYILPDSIQRSRLLLAYLIGMPIRKNAFAGRCEPCSTPNQTGCFVSWRTYGKNYYPPVHGDSIFAINPITWSTQSTENKLIDHRGILFGSGNIKHPGSLTVSAQNGTLQVRELSMPFSSFYRWKNYHIGDYNLFWLNIQDNFTTRIQAWESSHP